MPKFRKKPIEIEAEQFDPLKPVVDWPAGVVPWSDPVPRDMSWGYIETLEGRMHVSAGDWIITGVKGEKYPCKPDIFEASYDSMAAAPAGSEERKTAMDVLCAANNKMATECLQLRQENEALRAVAKHDKFAEKYRPEFIQMAEMKGPNSHNAHWGDICVVLDAKLRNLRAVAAGKAIQLQKGQQLFEPTGEVRTPKAGEWFDNSEPNGFGSSVRAQFGQAKRDFVKNEYPIYVRHVGPCAVPARPQTEPVAK